MLHPAPSRGRYDRTVPTPARHAQQRERLLLATTQTLAEHGPRLNVAHVVAAARVGRNTFYEHFDDLHDAVTLAIARHASGLGERMQRSIADAWTPRERLRNAVGAWIDFVCEEPTVARAMFNQPSHTRHFPLSRAADPLRETLRELLIEARRDAVVSTEPNDPRLLAVTAAVEAIGRWRVEQPWTKTDCAAVAVDVVLRAFR